MRMDCTRFAEHINAYVDHAVPPEIRAAMQAHATSCPACRGEIEALVQLESVLHSAPEAPVPQGFAAHVMARAATQKAPRKLSVLAWAGLPGWWQELPGPARAAAAAILVVGLALGGVMGWDANRNGSNAAPPAAPADALAAYNLDYLAEAPAGSLAQVVLALNQ